MNGKHIELFLVDGVAGGVTTAEIIGWTGHVLIGPRADFGEIMKRPEAERNGVYLLLGDSDEPLGRPNCYIGKTEVLSTRFRDPAHPRHEDWWSRIALITAKDDSFNEGHWGYLESELVRLAVEADRVELTNRQSPRLRKLSEAQVSDMVAFIANLQMILPVLNVNAIRTRRAIEIATSEPTDSPVFSLVQNKIGVNARAQVFNGDEFTMLKGSKVVASWEAVGNSESTQRSYAAYRARHEHLVADGSIVVEGGLGVLQRDVVFSSPSGAAAVALGRSSNGRNEWACSGGTYAQWEERGLNVEHTIS